MQAFNYQFNVNGDFTSKMSQMNEAVGEFSAKVENAQGWAMQLAQKLATFDLACGLKKIVINQGMGSEPLNNTLLVRSAR